MKLRVNGELHELGDDYRQAPLLWALRDGLGLAGTKYGCGIGVCGSCTVHLDGAPARSCLITAEAAAGRDVRTVEGLAQNGRLHPVQRAFIEEQVPQCAWCMNGQMMTAAALIASNTTPSREEIVAGMRSNYCRCGCYARIRTAVARAAELSRETERG
jgi:isoquinoline 1-oxidoreductase alpha subunit